MAITLSVCMIVKDEESVIERCLRSVSKLADGIIILDTGSSDRTMEITKNLLISSKITQITRHIYWNIM